MTKQMTQPHLFTVRVWLEEMEDGQYDCRGRLQHGLEGTARHFQGWAALIDLMTDVMDASSRIEIGIAPAENATPILLDVETDPPEVDTDGSNPAP